MSKIVGAASTSARAVNSTLNAAPKAVSAVRSTPGLSVPQLLAAGVGGILLYAAIKDKSPIEVLKSSLSTNTQSPGITTPGTGGTGGTGGTTGTDGTSSPQSESSPGVKSKPVPDSGNFVYVPGPRYGGKGG